MKTTITKTKIQEFLKTKLSCNETWAKSALIKIYEFQTSEEQVSEHTKFINGVGFTGIDGEILSSFAKQLQVKGFLSPKQMDILFKKMPKYWNQIFMISDINKLELMVSKQLN